MNIIKRIIPSVSGIITGIFVWDLQTNKNLVNLVLLSSLFFVLFNIVWISYSITVLKKNPKKLEKDALTFIPFWALLLFPIKYIADFDMKYSQFGDIPSAILLIFSISVFIFLKILFYRGGIKDLKNDKLVYLVMILYLILFSVLTILKHTSFLSTSYDLAIYDQTVWGYKNLQLTDSIAGFPMIAAHVQPILFLVSLFYLIYSSPITLLVVQTMMIALGALPIYLLTKKVLKNRLAALSISTAYLIYPSIHFANLFDFHPLVLAVPFILFSFYFLEKHNYKAFMISIILAGLCKEYIPLIFLPLGIYLFLAHKKRGLGILIALIGLIWFVISIRLIIPYFLGGDYMYIGTSANIYFGSSLSEVIKTLITRPIYSLKYIFVLNKAAFLILLLTPVAFGLFAFLSPGFLLLGITEFAILLLYIPNSLSEIVYHHQVLTIPFIMVATIYGIKKANKFLKNWKNITKRNIMAAISVLLLCTALLANISYGPFAILYDLKDFNPYTDYVKTGNRFVSMIPEDVAVAAQNWVLPHLSQREKAYTLSHFLKKDKTLFESGELEYPEYILIDLSEALIDPKRSAVKIDSRDLNNLFNNKRYGIIKSEGTWLLLKKGENYEQNLCKILPYLNKEEYPYLKINLNDEEFLKKCWQER